MIPLTSIQAHQSRVISAMLADTGIDPRNIYCQMTGAPIARLSDHEFNLMWVSLPRHADDDALIDDLYTRTLIAMRTSPTWTYVRGFTLNRVRQHDPISVCAYLLGRYFAPRDSAYSPVKRSVTQRMQDGINRIQTYARLRETAIPIESLRKFTTALLLLDAHFDLSAMDQMTNFPKSPLDIDLSQLGKYIEALDTMYLTLCETKADLERRARLQNSWLAKGGNRMANDAAFKAHMETRPQSEATLERKAKTEAKNAMVNALRVLMDGKESTIKPVPEIKPAIGAFKLRMPALGGSNNV